MPKDLEALTVLRRDGDRLDDRDAEKIGGQLLSRRMDYAYPVREPTMTFEQTELNRAPIQRGSMVIETGSPLEGMADSRLLMADGPQMFDSARSGLRNADDDGPSWPWLPMGAAMVAALLLVVSVLWAIHIMGQEKALDLEERRIELQEREALKPDGATTEAGTQRSPADSPSDQQPDGIHSQPAGGTGPGTTGGTGGGAGQ